MVREAEQVDGPGPVVVPGIVAVGPMKWHEPRLVRMQRQAVLAESLRQDVEHPHGVFLPGRRERYSEVSDQVMAILRQFTPIMEPVSVDEAFLDVRGVLHRWHDPVTIAKAELWKIGQVKPGDTLRFHPISFQQAQSLEQAQLGSIAALAAISAVSLRVCFMPALFLVLPKNSVVVHKR